MANSCTSPIFLNIWGWAIKCVFFRYVYSFCLGSWYVFFFTISLSKCVKICLCVLCLIIFVFNFVRFSYRVCKSYRQTKTNDSISWQVEKTVSLIVSYYISVGKSYATTHTHTHNFLLNMHMYIFMYTYSRLYYLHLVKSKRKSSFISYMAVGIPRIDYHSINTLVPN